MTWTKLISSKKKLPSYPHLKKNMMIIKIKCLHIFCSEMDEVIKRIQVSNLFSLGLTLSLTFIKYSLHFNIIKISGSKFLYDLKCLFHFRMTLKGLKNMFKTF